MFFNIYIKVGKVKKYKMATKKVNKTLQQIKNSRNHRSFNKEKSEKYTNDLIELCNTTINIRKPTTA